MLNKVILIGRVYDVQVSFTDEGLARLVLVVKTWYGKTSEYHRVVFFDPTVEKAYKYYEILKDGNYNGYVYVEGRLNYRTYQAQDGSKRKVVSIIARQIRILNPPSNGETLAKEETQPVIAETKPATLRPEKPELTQETTQKTLPKNFEPIDYSKIEGEIEAIDEDELPF